MKRVKIAAKPTHPDPKKRFMHDVDVILGDDIENVYDVFEKDFPNTLPYQWTDPDDRLTKNITWSSNFGLQKKDGTPVTRLENNKTYSIELNKNAGKLVHWNGTRVEKLPIRDLGKVIQADLNLGDPPVGWT
jgi:hypothetical protein